MSIGTRVRQYREAKNWSQDDLAVRLDTTQTTISNIESDKNIPNSELFKKWEAYASTLTEDAVYRDLTGLEAWFRSPTAPSRCKMALVTLCGVFPTSIFLNYTIGHWIKDGNVLLRIFMVAACMVGLLTWVVMPFMTKVFKGWLRK